MEIEHNMDNILAQVKEYYDELVRINTNLFEEKVLAPAKKYLSGDPEKAESVLMEIVESASYLRPSEIPQFFNEIISEETFTYHRDFQLAEQEREKQIPGKVFHINKILLIDRLDEYIIPEYILNGKEFDQQNYDGNEDYYEVCFAIGPISDLAMFLGGHSFIDDYKESRWDLDSEDFKILLNSPKSNLYGIIVVNSNNTKPSHLGRHTIETSYFGSPKPLDKMEHILDSDNCVDMEVSRERIPIESILTIPYIVWTDDLIEEKEREAKEYLTLNQILLQRELTPELLEEEIFTKCYVESKKFEQAIQFALYTFMKNQE